jgi:hypothetical protein
MSANVNLAFPKFYRNTLLTIGTARILVDKPESASIFGEMHIEPILFLLIEIIAIVVVGKAI